MYTLVIAVHIVLAITLIGLVLLQQGKGADVGAIMSGGGANTLFGVGGASSLLVRMTTSVAILFMLTSVLLVKLSASGGRGPVRSDAMQGSVVEGMAVATPAEATPASAAAVVTPVQPEQAPAMPQETPAAPQNGAVGTASKEPQATTPAASGH